MEPSTPGENRAPAGAKASATRLAFVGLDALDADFVLAHASDLPTFGRLLGGQSSHPLASPASLLTSSVWPTFSSGRSPGHHGVYYPLQWDPQAMRFRRVDEHWLPYEPFWLALDRAGVGVTTFDVPFLPATPLERGLEVRNWGSQECLGPFGSNRPEVERAIRRRFGLHPMGSEVPLEQPTARLARLRDRLVAGAALKARVARHLLDETDPDFFVVVFAEPHRAGHLLWPEQGPRRTPVPEDALLDVYRAVDRAVGEVLERLEERGTPAVVFSPHGMGPNRTQEHFVLEVVRRAALVAGGGSVPEDEGRQGGGLVALARSLVPDRAQELLARLLPDAVRDWVVARTFLGGMDLERAPFFALPHSGEGYVRFVLAGREAAGRLARDGAEFERHERLLREAFETLEDESGRRVVRDVVPPAEEWPGPRADLLPDLVVRFADVPPAEVLRGPVIGTLRGRLGTGRTGEHRPEGFVAVHDPHGRLSDPLPGDVGGLAALALDWFGVKAV